MSYPNDDNEIIPKDIVNALLEVVNEDDLKSIKTKKVSFHKKDIVESFNNICKFMCGVEDISFEKFDKSSINRYFCYYSIKIKDKINNFEFLVSVELMNIIIEMMINEEDCFLTRNIIDEITIDGARVIFETLLNELEIDDDIEIKIKSDYKLKGNKTFYKFKIDDFNGLVCIKTKNKKDVK